MLPKFFQFHSIIPKLILTYLTFIHLWSILPLQRNHSKHFVFLRHAAVSLPQASWYCSPMLARLFPLPLFCSRWFLLRFGFASMCCCASICFDVLGFLLHVIDYVGEAATHRRRQNAVSVSKERREALVCYSIAIFNFCPKVFMAEPSVCHSMMIRLREGCRYYTGYPKDLGPSRVIHFTSEGEFVQLLHQGYPVVVAFTMREGISCVNQNVEIDNDMMLDEEQAVLDAQTFIAVQELNSSTVYKGKGAMQKRVSALRELRRLLSKSVAPC